MADVETEAQTEPDCAAVPAPIRSRPWRREAAWVAGAGLLSLLAAVLILRVWHASLRVPLIQARGDNLVNLSLVKAMVDHGWYWTNPNLGAPAGAPLYDFSLYFGDLSQFTLMKAMTLFSGDPVLIYNVFMLLGFPLTAISAFAVMRSFGCSRGPALVASSLFALLPWHLLLMGTFLAAYYAVPIAIWLAVCVLQGRELFARRDGSTGWRSRLSFSSLRTLVLCAIVAISSIYWAAFALLTIIGCVVIGAAARRSAGPLVQGAVVLAMIFCCLSVTQAPALIYRAEHGANPVVGKRLPKESETYGLKLAPLVVPSPGHHFAPFAKAGQRYESKTSLPAEGPISWLGTVGVVGFFVGIGTLLVLGLRDRCGPRVASVASMGFVSLSALVVANVGGFSMLIATFISPQIRGWNRISVFIAFAALLVVAQLLTMLSDRLRPLARIHRWGVPIGLAGLFAVGIADQSPRTLGVPARYSDFNEQWRIYGGYVAGIEATLPPDANVLQLPYVPFPENPAVNKMVDYDHLIPYVHSDDVAWSYGSMRGRAADWGAQTPQLQPGPLVNAAAAAGFDGVWVNRAGYADNGRAVIDGILAAVPDARTVDSPDGLITYVSLDGVADRLRQRVGSRGLRAISAALLKPTVSTFGAGFYEPESDAKEAWRYMKSQATIDINNPDSAPRTVLVSGVLEGVSSAQSSRVRIIASSVAKTVVAPPGGGRVRLRVRVPAGKSTVRFEVSGPIGAPKAGDARTDVAVRFVSPIAVDPLLAPTDIGGDQR